MKSSLKAFIKGSSNPKDMMPGCANLDTTGCLFPTDGDKSPCLVQIGKPCAYFEKAVLPTAKDIGKAEQIYRAYAKQIGVDADALAGSVQQRTCPGCDDALKITEKYCKRCTIAQRY